MSRWGETVTHRYRLQGCQVGPVDDDDDDNDGLQVPGVPTLLRVRA